jgi:hypothetical protein
MLARSVNLPELRAGDPPFWSPVDTHSASSVLAAIERRATARGAERTPEIVLRPIKGDPR